MSKIKIYQTALSLTIASTGILVNAISPASSAIINFEINFFDESNIQVGSGAFSFNDEVLTCVRESPLGVCEPDSVVAVPDPNPITFVENALTDLSATIDGESWFLTQTTWWSDEETTQAPGYQFISRGGASITENSWFFGDPFFGERTLNMAFDLTSETNGEGTWSQVVFVSNSSAPKSNSGTWEANIIEIISEPSEPSSVPEPMSILGLFCAVGCGYFARHARSSNIQ